jgi:hypothetical protein
MPVKHTFVFTATFNEVPPFYDQEFMRRRLQAIMAYEKPFRDAAALSCVHSAEECEAVKE